MADDMSTETTQHQSPPFEGDKITLPTRSGIDDQMGEHNDQLKLGLINGNISPYVENIQRASSKTPEERLNSTYREHLSAISMLRRDLGESVQEVAYYTSSLPNPNNYKDKQTILDDLKRERINLAVRNFPGYVAIWLKLDHERKKLIDQLVSDFESDHIDEEKKAKISEQARAELDRGLNAKASYYAEMLKTLLIEGGLPHDEAEEIAVSKSQDVVGINAIHHKAEIFLAFRNESLGVLVSTLHRSIMVWDEMFPGQGEEEELDILGQGENSRTSKAKALYKKTMAEIERRRSDYKLRLVRYLKQTQGKSSSEAHHESQNSEGRLMELPRIEQVRIMNSGRFI
ncbi:MAG: hypothetical protein A3A51_01405 [Candidatus Levybacteria bacterium RIFCSPLOWO2_01_FULL_39_10]|nr:MAG: hypothetical protein A3A51_01405 [Candidatus Levybacteria bacterium RIFCSPLOWO2_01_FULL_39_10]